MLLLVEEILHHLGCIEPCKEWDILHINWCKISAIDSIISQVYVSLQLYALSQATQS